MIPLIPQQQLSSTSSLWRRQTQVATNCGTSRWNSSEQPEQRPAHLFLAKMIAVFSS